MFSYDKLFQKMQDCGMTNKELCQKADISINMPARIKSGASITTETLDKFCMIFDCQPNDIMEWFPDGKEIERRKIQSEIESLQKKLAEL